MNWYLFGGCLAAFISWSFFLYKLIGLNENLDDLQKSLEEINQIFEKAIAGR